VTVPELELRAAAAGSATMHIVFIERSCSCPPVLSSTPTNASSSLRFSATLDAWSLPGYAADWCKKNPLPSLYCAFVAFDVPASTCSR